MKVQTFLKDNYTLPISGLDIAHSICGSQDSGSYTFAFWNITTLSLLKVNGWLVGTYHLNVFLRKVGRKRYQHEAGSKHEIESFFSNMDKNCCVLQIDERMIIHNFNIGKTCRVMLPTFGKDSIV
jgi:hypothetical protein